MLIFMFNNFFFIIFVFTVEYVLWLFLGRYWETVQRLRINQFYGAPTAIRLLLKYEENWVKKYDRSSLKTLGSGETTDV